MVRRLVTAGVDGDHYIEVDEHLPLAVVVQRRDLFGHTVDGSDGGLYPPRPGLGVLGFGNQLLARALQASLPLLDLAHHVQQTPFRVITLR